MKIRDYAGIQEQLALDKFLVFCGEDRFIRISEVYSLWEQLIKYEIDYLKVWDLLVKSNFKVATPMTLAADILSDMEMCLNNFWSNNVVMGCSLRSPAMTEILEVISKFITKVYFAGRERVIKGCDYKEDADKTEIEIFDRLYNFTASFEYGVENPVTALRSRGLWWRFYPETMLSNRWDLTFGHFHMHKTEVLPIDKINYVEPDKDNPNRLVPTMERALIDSIRMQDEIYEEPIVESFGSYPTVIKSQDMSKLYEVADFYKVPRSEVDYWLKEGYEYINRTY